MTQHIRLEVNAPFGEIILNRPGRRNALSVNMWAQIPDLISATEADENVRVVLLHGGSTGHFAAGADISEFPEIYATREQAHRSGETIATALQAVESCTKPVIAAIEGSCVGGGASLAMAADIRISSSAARFGITPAKLGLVYPTSDTRRLVKAIGASRAKDLLFTGRLFPAEEAASYGLVDFVCPRTTDVVTYAKNYALSFLENSQWSVRAIKRMIAGIETGWSDKDPNATNLFLDGFENDDFNEGHRAFLEKRPPRFPVR